MVISRPSRSSADNNTASGLPLRVNETRSCCSRTSAARGHAFRLGAQQVGVPELVDDLVGNPEHLEVDDAASRFAVHDVDHAGEERVLTIPGHDDRTGLIRSGSAASSRNDHTWPVASI